VNFSSSQSLDAFLTIAQGKPAALTANTGQVVTSDCPPDSLQDIPPLNRHARVQPKQSQHMPVLGLHRFLGCISVESATGNGLMRTGPAHCVRRINKFDPPVRILSQFPMDGGQVLDKVWTVSPAPKPLQAQERMASQPQPSLYQNRFHKGISPSEHLKECSIVSSQFGLSQKRSSGGFQQTDPERNNNTR
jgi:hypothetical protein